MELSIEWLHESVSSITAVCAVIAVVECLADGAEDSGLRFVCGAAAAATLLRMAADGLKAIL